MPVIESKFTFFKMIIERLFLDPTELGEPCFSIAPKAFNTINMYFSSNKFVLINYKKLNIIPSKSEVISHQRIAINQQNLEESQLVSCRDWINKLHKINNDKMVYPIEKFSKTLYDMWDDLCFSSTRFGIWSLQLFFSAGFINYKYLNVKRTVGFFIRCLYPKNNYNI